MLVRSMVPMIFGGLLLSFILFSCGNPTTPEQKTTQIRHSEPAKAAYTDTFRLAANFPEITDTAAFIKKLVDVFDLEVDHFIKEGDQIGWINSYEKITIAGMEEEFIFVDYQYEAGAMSTFPWRYQILMTKYGVPVDAINGMNYRLLEIDPHQLPFLCITFATAKGNGGHRIYRIENGKAENVYEGYYDYNLKTYDCHQDLAIYDPCELDLEVEDFNGDGYEDLSFTGELVYLMKKHPDDFWYDVELRDGEEIVFSTENPARTVPIQFIFLYNPTTEHFEAAEDYKEKYQLNF